MRHGNKLRFHKLNIRIKKLEKIEEARQSRIHASMMARIPLSKFDAPPGMPEEYLNMIYGVK